MADDILGTQIGPFVLQRLLGAGGMGRVYLAEHALMKDLHAVKILDPALTRNAELVARFINEARAASRLRHRNLIRVHNIEQLPDGGSWFMVLDYLDGSPLSRFIAAQPGAIPPPRVLHILAQVASCMQHVHDHRIVHRDLKPENIFLVRAGDDPHCPIILDLGVAQLGEDFGVGPGTQTGTLLGTPIYMAPEQLRGERVTPAADVFALGVIGYEMSTGGYFPYQRDEPRAGYIALPATELYYRQRTSPPVDPRSRCAGIDDAWAEALLAALDHDPANRPASARDLALRLAGALGPAGLEIVTRVARDLMTDDAATAPHAPAVRSPDAADTEDTEADGRALPPAMTTLAGVASQTFPVVAAPPPPRRGVRAAVAALVAVGLAAAALGALLLRSGDAPPAVAARDEAPRPAVAGVAAAPSVDVPVLGYGRLGDRLSQGNRARVQPQPSGGGSASGGWAAGGSATGGSAVEAEEDPVVRRPAGPPRPSVAPSRAPARPSATARQRPGELAIIVRPWALVWLDGKPLGQTPFRGKLAAGRYTVRIANDVAGKDETATITVRADQITTLQRSW